MKLPVPGEIRTILSRYGKHIVEQDFTFPDGKVEDFVVMIPWKVPVMVLPLTREMEVIALRQFRYGADETVIEFPGGNSKNSETQEETVARELLEETGYRPGTLMCLNRNGLWIDPAFIRVRFIPFLAADCEYVQEEKPDHSEFLEVVKVPLKE